MHVTYNLRPGDVAALDHFGALRRRVGRDRSAGHRDASGRDAHAEGDADIAFNRAGLGQTLHEFGHGSGRSTADGSLAAVLWAAAIPSVEATTPSTTVTIALRGRACRVAAGGSGAYFQGAAGDLNPYQSGGRHRDGWSAGTHRSRDRRLDWTVPRSPRSPATAQQPGWLDLPLSRSRRRRSSPTPLRLGHLRRDRLADATRPPAPPASSSDGRPSTTPPGAVGAHADPVLASGWVDDPRPRARGGSSIDIRLHPRGQRLLAGSVTSMRRRSICHLAAAVADLGRRVGVERTWRSSEAASSRTPGRVRWGVTERRRGRRRRPGSAPRTVMDSSCASSVDVLPDGWRPPDGAPPPTSSVRRALARVPAADAGLTLRDDHRGHRRGTARHSYHPTSRWAGASMAFSNVSERGRPRKDARSRSTSRWSGRSAGPTTPRPRHGS